MLTRETLVLCAILAAAPPFAAQDLPVGRRTRITMNDSSSMIARVDSARDGRIWLSSGMATRAVDLEQVHRIDVSQGRKPKWLLGTAAGAGLGLLTGLALKSAIESDLASDDDQIVTLAYLGAGAGGGALIGLGLSFVLAGERWEPLPESRWAAPQRARDPSTNPGWRLGLRISR